MSPEGTNGEEIKNTNEVTADQAPGEALQAEQGIASKDAFEAGRARMAAMSESVSKVKENTKALFSAVGDKFSKFWSRTKKFGGEAVAAVLSADVLTERAASYVDQKVDQFDKFTDAKVEQAGFVIGQNLAQGYEWSKDRINEAGQGIKDAGNYVADKAIQADAWMEKKGAQLDTYVLEKAELVKDVAFAVKEGTIETINKARDGVAKRYDQLVDFKDNSIASAEAKYAQIKQNFRNKLNEMRMNRLMAKMEKQLEKKEKADTRLANLQQKMGLMQSLQQAA